MHAIVEYTKLAFADRERWVSDPLFHPAPVEKMLDPAYIGACADRMDMGRARTFTSLLDPKGDTVWLGVVDRTGNAVSMIQSIYNDFGSAVIPAGTGVLLQNRGSFFSLDPRHVNALEPGKRTMHTLNPPMLLRNGRPYLVYGTMGGEGQPQTQAALVTRIIDGGMTPQQAVDGPRWLYGHSWGAPSNSLKIERGFDSQVYANLQSAATMWRWSTATRTSWAMPALSSSATAQLMTGRQFSAGLQIRAATVLPAATDAMPTQQR